MKTKMENVNLVFGSGRVATNKLTEYYQKLTLTYTTGITVDCRIMEGLDAAGSIKHGQILSYKGYLAGDKEKNYVVVTSYTVE